LRSVGKSKSEKRRSTEEDDEEDEDEGDEDDFVKPRLVKWLFFPFSLARFASTSFHSN